MKRKHSYKTYGWYFPTFLCFSRLKRNLSKCEIAGIGLLKGVQVVVCGMRCVDLNNYTLTWIRRLYGHSFREWKWMPLYLIKKSLGTSFKFHSNLFFKTIKINFSPSFYREIFYTEKSILLQGLNFVTVSMVQWKYPAT